MAYTKPMRAMMVLVVALLAALSTALVLWEARPAEAAFPGSTGAIAFTKIDPGGPARDVYRMNADGFGQAQISSPLQFWGQASWSANGRLIVLTDVGNGANNDIHVMNADGSGLQPIFNDPNFSDEQPALSKDSTRIFFVRRQGNIGPHDIYMLNLAQPGSRPVQITNTPARDERDPAVSPDGTRLAFASDRDGDFDLYVMKAAREGATNVAQKITRDRNQNPVFAAELTPDWSPDGKRLAFTSTRTTDAEVFRMNAAPESKTNRPVNLTKSSATTDADPAWSPDNRKVAFISSPVGGGDTEIFRMNASDGANKTNLTNDPGHTDLEPSWQPLP